MATMGLTAGWALSLLVTELSQNILQPIRAPVSRSLAGRQIGKHATDDVNQNGKVFGEIDHGPIRCMAESHDSRWWAICLDFDVAVEGNSFPEVRDRLHQAVDTYLERVSEPPEHERARLPRPCAPWYLRIRFHFLSLLGKFRDDDSDRRRQFVIPAHA